MANAHTDYTMQEPRSMRDYSPTPGEVIRTTLLNRVSWGAVFAGVVIAFAVQLVLNLLGLGFGFATMDSITGEGFSSYEFSWAGAVWWTIAALIASGIGGFTAGRLAGEPKTSTSAWHGLISWAASILVIAVLMTTAAGATATMSGPFRVAMDQGSAVVSPGNATTAPQVTASSGPATTATTTPGYAGTANTPVIDSDTVAAASLATAVALILGAIAAWLGGRAGTVRNPDRRDSRMSVSTH